MNMRSTVREFLHTHERTYRQTDVRIFFHSKLLAPNMSCACVSACVCVCVYISVSDVTVV